MFRYPGKTSINRDKLGGLEDEDEADVEGGKGVELAELQAEASALVMGTNDTSNV